MYSHFRGLMAKKSDPACSSAVSDFWEGGGENSAAVLCPPGQKK